MLRRLLGEEGRRSDASDGDASSAAGEEAAAAGLSPPPDPAEVGSSLTAWEDLTPPQVLDNYLEGLVNFGNEERDVSTFPDLLDFLLHVLRNRVPDWHSGPKTTKRAVIGAIRNWLQVRELHLEGNDLLPFPAKKSNFPSIAVLIAASVRTADPGHSDSFRGFPSYTPSNSPHIASCSP